ncbi:DUF3108 domain-containing protein [Phocaeicola sp.]
MKKTILILLCTWFVALAANAQCAAKNEAIQAGEELTYDLKFNWKFIWVGAGQAKLDMQAITYQGKPCFRSSLISVSNKQVDFFFKMRDTLTCITSSRLEPLYFRKGAEEGDRYTVDEVWFSYKDDKCIAKQQRMRRGRDTVRSKEESNECIFDMLSIVMQARSFDVDDYTVGQKIMFPMATGTKVEEQTLIYRGKKNFKDESGIKYRCLVFSLVEYKKGKEKEVITFYITDDKNHLPVRLDLYLNFGSAKAFLKEIKGNRHPMTSIIEK